VDTEDNLVTEYDGSEYQNRSYDALSSEFQTLYPSAVRAFQLVGLMYNRLTLVEKLSHKVALAKICNDHRDLPGFSQRNIQRNLPVDNPYVPRRIRPSWPENSTNESNESAKLSVTTQEWEKQPDVLSTS
jgi:hypothetical protein